MASKAYPITLQGQFDGNALDWTDAGTTFKAMLVQAGYTYANTQDFYDDVSASQYSGTTDQTLASGNRTVTQSGDNVNINYTTTVTWSSVSISGTDDAIGVIIYQDTGTPGTSKLVAYDDAVDVTPNGGDITYTPSSNIIVQLQT